MTCTFTFDDVAPGPTGHAGEAPRWLVAPLTIAAARGTTPVGDDPDAAERAPRTASGEAARRRPRRAVHACRAVARSADRAAPAAGAALAAGAAPAAPHSRSSGRRAPPSDDRRRQLWRDSATILIGVVLALLVGQTLIPAPASGPGGSSPTPLPAAVAIGSLPPPDQPAARGDVRPDHRPEPRHRRHATPIPVITMGPTPSPSPEPSPLGQADGSPKPHAEADPEAHAERRRRNRRSSPRPTRRRWSRPLRRPRGFTSDATVAHGPRSRTPSTGATSWSWDFGDGESSSASENPDAYVPRSHRAADTYTVTLTVTGRGRQRTPISHTVTVPPPPERTASGPLVYSRGLARWRVIEPGKTGAYLALFSEIGFILFVTHPGGALGGHWLDEQLGIRFPIFLLAGLLLGMAPVRWPSGG